MPFRRTLIALAISLALHAALVASFAGVAVFRGWKLARTVDIELVSVTTKEVDQLPLGPPPPPPGSARKAAAGRRARSKTADDGVKLAVADGGADVAPGPTADAGDGGARDAGREAGPDAGGEADGRDGGLRRPKDGRLAGPAGSRLTALLRIDRLRAAPEAPATIAAVDGLLRHLPDRRRLLDGTGLDLYRDFDALFVATPNPLDDAVTFLVVRHRLSDAKLMEALGRGAETAGRPITWRTEGGRPVGLRAARRVETDPAAGAAPVPRVARIDRDDRIFVLPQPGMAVMAPPAYAALLLGSRGLADAGVEPAGASERRWRELVARIDAEDAAMPAEAVLLMSATNLLGTKQERGAPAGDIPGGIPVQGLNGLPLPTFLSMQSGVTPGPYLELAGTFERAADAAAWAAAWPGVKQTLLGSPLLLLSGFSPIVARADLQQDDNTTVLRTTGSNEELRRLLGMIANLIGPARR